MAEVNHAALRALRIKDGYSLTALARVAGLGRAHVSNIESGRRSCSVDAIRRLARALNVPMSAIEAPTAPRDEAVA